MASPPCDTDPDTPSIPIATGISTPSNRYWTNSRGRRNASEEEGRPRMEGGRVGGHVGKVHGSLARAGKVKGQTPKVEKQEKKKQQCGRAKKRLLYTRRFVNAVVGFGGKRRMNPNDGGNK
ncbi:hypothetical protein HDU98_006816 [Podochytrium sp. JEL0797]|nr:hypothetical protein HDU98_006816 [Podochytrium sp. JEL0797]